jgi:Na+-translocating ferredoxin:NAD+ oxidoreductase RnfG subunit
MLKRRFILCATLMLIGQSLTPGLGQRIDPKPVNRLSNHTDKHLSR